MTIELRVQQWSAWAPGLDTGDAWRAWARAPCAPRGEAVAAAAMVPPMLRRRLDPLGRAALQVAHEVLDGAAPAVSVFLSRRGDSARSLELLTALGEAQGMSPTSFGLSVHNAIAAQHSMLRGERAPYSALAAGREGVESALLEIAGQLAELGPEAQALLVVYEAPVPVPYQDYRDEPDALYAWAWRLARQGSGPGPRIQLQRGSAGSLPAEVDVLPSGLLPLYHLLAGTPTWCSVQPGWRWLRHD